MKRLTILFIVFVVLNSFSIYENKFSKLELDEIKKNYHWKDEKFLIINYFMPKTSCHYNNYSNPKKTKLWFDNNIYSNLNIESSKNICVFSDFESANKIIDKETYFADFNDFLLNKIFNNFSGCYGLLIINSDGKYNYFEGEYSKNNVNTILKELE
jgi:hypothetical protein